MTPDALDDVDAIDIELPELPELSLEELLGEDFEENEQQVDEKPRFYCRGADRRDEDNRRLCNYRARRKWYGPCPKCRCWYGCTQIKRAEGTSRGFMTLDRAMSAKPRERLRTGIPELDMVLGGDGLICGNTVMLGGERGQGKSTLILQMAYGLAKNGHIVFVASGEMPTDQVAEYAQRLWGKDADPAVLKRIGVFGDTRGLDVEEVISEARARKAKALLMDSLQVAYKDDKKADLGDATQVDAIVQYLTSASQEKKLASVIISHLTKSGDYKGTSTGQHLVDVLLRFEARPFFDAEGEVVAGSEKIRELSLDRKTRQGDADVTALLEMTAHGLMPLSTALKKRVARAAGPQGG